MITKPQGLDRPLQDMQNHFIKSLWPNVLAVKKSFNHRVFVKNSAVLKPEIFDGKDYKDVRFDDSLTALSWFDVSNQTNTFSNSTGVNEVGIVFIVNLEKLYPQLSHRAVEEVHYDVIKIINKMPREFKINSIVSGLDAYGDYDITQLKGANIQPFHVFRINCDVLFTLNC
jgi:hypothetical protein